MSNETVWTGLAEAEADGCACVVCGANFKHTKNKRVAVGRSRANKPVYACAGDCVDTAKQVN